MTVTPKKLAANRANARKSTGPRTQEGKDRSKMNGVTHGLFCADIVIPGEKWDDFETFRHAYLLQINPQDIVELTLVDRIVNAAWKLRRLSSIEFMANRLAARNIAEAQEEEYEEGKQMLSNHFREPVPIVEEDEPTIEERMSKIDGITAMTHQFTSRSLDEMERISRYEQRLELSMYRAMRQLDRYRKEKRESRKRTQCGDEEPMQPCPFVPESAREGTIDDENEGSEAKAERPVARVSSSCDEDGVPERDTASRGARREVNAQGSERNSRILPSRDDAA